MSVTMCLRKLGIETRRSDVPRINTTEQHNSRDAVAGKVGLPVQAQLG